MNRTRLATAIADAFDPITPVELPPNTLAAFERSIAWCGVDRGSSDGDCTVIGRMRRDGTLEILAEFYRSAEATPLLLLGYPLRPPAVLVS